MDGEKNRQMNEENDEEKDKWMERKIDRDKDGLSDGWMNEWLQQGEVDGWRKGRRRIDGWLEKIKKDTDTTKAMSALQTPNT